MRASHKGNQSTSKLPALSSWRVNGEHAIDLNEPGSTNNSGFGEGTHSNECMF